MSEKETEVERYLSEEITSRVNSLNRLLEGRYRITVLSPFDVGITSLSGESTPESLIKDCRALTKPQYESIINAKMVYAIGGFTQGLVIGRGLDEKLVLPGLNGRLARREIRWKNESDLEDPYKKPGTLIREAFCKITDYVNKWQMYNELPTDENGFWVQQAKREDFE